MLKESDDKQSVENKEALKVTVTNFAAFINDNADIRVAGSVYDSKTNPMKWIVNEVEETDGQVQYSVSKEYFYGGKTAVLQSKSGYLIASITISAFAMKSPFTLTYKVEKGSKDMVEKTETINPGATAFTLALHC